VDLIGPLPPSEGDGYVYILVAVDVFSRYAVVTPIKDGTAESVLRALHVHYFGILGFPSVLQFDGGKSFDNALLTSEMERHGVQCHRTTPYNHKSNGIVERANRTILEQVRTLIDGNTRRWADILWGATLAYNTAVHSSTGFAPSSVLLRFKPATPLALRSQFGEEEGSASSPPSVATVTATASTAIPSATSSDVRGTDTSIAQFIDRTDRELPDILDKLTRSQQAASRKQRVQHDKLVTPVSFKADDYVFVHFEQRDGSNKLAAYWRGPLRIKGALHRRSTARKW
jgi:hypothetical protein